MNKKEVKELARHCLVNVLDLDTQTIYPVYNFFQGANKGDFIEDINKEPGLSYSGYIKRKVWRKEYGQSHLILEISKKM